MSHPNDVIKTTLDAKQGSEALDAAILRWISTILGDRAPETCPTLPVSRSLDAATRLVPDEYGWRCWTDLETGMGHARLTQVHGTSGSEKTPRRVDCQFQIAHSAALALCVAAINAINVEETLPPAFREAPRSSASKA